jgi:hypothetical protein
MGFHQNLLRWQALPLLSEGGNDDCFVPLVGVHRLLKFLGSGSCKFESVSKHSALCSAPSLQKGRELGGYVTAPYLTSYQGEIEFCCLSEYPQIVI